MKKVSLIIVVFFLFLFIFQINTPLIHADTQPVITPGGACTGAGSVCGALSNGSKLKCNDDSICAIVPPPPPCEKLDPKTGTCSYFGSGLGSLSTDAAGFISTVFRVILSVSGGIAILLMMRAGYKIMTSQGNPEAVKEGREQLIAAIVGLLFLIFSLVLLQTIGVDILKIPKLIK